MHAGSAFMLHHKVEVTVLQVASYQHLELLSRRVLVSC